MMKDYTLFEKWQLPGVRNKLKLFSGILLEGGDIVKLPLNRNGNIFQVNIPTSHRVKQKPMWLKKVYFYVGFSFQGPRAYGMSTEDPGVAIQTIPRSLANANAVYRAPRPFNGPKLADLIAEQKDFEKHLERHKGTSRATELKRKLQEINKKIKSILGSSE